MKNISTLITGLLFINFSINSQNICPTAETITSGTHTFSNIVLGGPPPVPNCADNFGAATGARWYRFQATVDGFATVSSDHPINSNKDTRVTVYTGECSGLICLEGNDDIDGPTIKTSMASFPVTNGTHYYIVWDNTWTNDGFEFTLTETTVDCSSIDLPINEDFDDYNTFVACIKTETVDANITDFEQRIFDWDGDGTDEDYASNGSTSTIAKNDWLFSTPIDLVTGHEYAITFKYNGANGSFPANENLDVYFMDGPSSGATSLVSLFSDTGIVKVGTNAQAESMATSESIIYTSTATGTYYLGFNGTSAENTGSLLLFEYSVTENTLGVSDFRLDGVTNSFDKVTDVLTIKSKNLPLDNVEIYDILGQKVLTKKLSRKVERLNLSELYDGIYIIRISSSGLMTTSKLLKQ